MAAAEAARAAGFPHVYNVADGFEGPPDADGSSRRRPAGRQTACRGGSGDADFLSRARIEFDGGAYRAI